MSTGLKKAWKGFKEVATEKANTPMWVFYLLAVGVLALTMFADINGHDEGYWDGYNDALEESEEQSLYMIWLDYDFDTRQESFWSVIMWDVATHTKEIFVVLALFLLFLAVRF